MWTRLLLLCIGCTSEFTGVRLRHRALVLHCSPRPPPQTGTHMHTLFWLSGFHNSISKLHIKKIGFLINKKPQLIGLPLIFFSSLLTSSVGEKCFPPLQTRIYLFFITRINCLLYFTEQLLTHNKLLQFNRISIKFCLFYNRHSGLMR